MPKPTSLSDNSAPCANNYNLKQHEMKVQHRLLTNPITRPALRNAEHYQINEIRAIVLHWTGNKNRGANANAHTRYFNETKRYASAHIFVDDQRIVQHIPLSEPAYHCGGKHYTSLGQRLKEGYKSPNYTTWGVEVCVNKDADFEQTYQNTIAVFANLLCYSVAALDNNLFVEGITTHHEITGKACPQFPDRNGDFRLIEGESLENFRREVEVAFWDLKEELEFVV